MSVQLGNTIITFLSIQKGSVISKTSVYEKH